MDNYLQVQVVYNQGLVKIFLANQEILLAEFINAARAYGRIKVMRFMPNVDQYAAKLLVDTGNAVMVNAKKEPAHG